ncbi:unnamed protein product [Prunus brigantina]
MVPGVVPSAILSALNYEVLGRLVFTLFEGSNITDGDFWQDPEIVVMEDIFHLLLSGPFSFSGLRFHHLFDHSLKCPHVI